MPLRFRVPVVRGAHAGSRKDRERNCAEDRGADSEESDKGLKSKGTGKESAISANARFGLLKRL